MESMLKFDNLVKSPGSNYWIPAFSGMTKNVVFDFLRIY